MAINTRRIVNDDRVLKEINTLRKQGHSVDILCVESSNKRWRRVNSEAEKEEAITLWTRIFIPSGKAVFAKAAEWALRVRLHCFKKDYDVVWFHNLDLALLPFLFFGKNRPTYLVWDQHELPPPAWLTNSKLGSMFVNSANRCNAIVMANEERINFVKERFGPRWLSPVFSIKNFPTSSYRATQIKPLSVKSREWLRGRQYLFASGGAGPGRHFQTLVDAVMEVKELALVVAGPITQEENDLMLTRHGRSVVDKIFLTGLIGQAELQQWLDHSLASVILYTIDDDNCRLCAPNRMYQAIVRNIPIIAGCNPPLVETISATKSGIVLPDDGRKTAPLVAAIREMQKSSQGFRADMAIYREQFLWEYQTDNFSKILGIHAPEISPALENTMV